MQKVSVIIPVYNTEKYISQCLDSVCGQTLEDIEIICINDCSIDSSLKIVQDFAQKDSRIKLINFTENKGAAAARNAGIDAATGEYIGFVDSDDFIDLNFYEKLYTKAKETGADVAKSNLIVENSLCYRINEYHNFKDIEKCIFNLNHIPTTIIKTDLLLKHNIKFPEDLYNSEDSVFEVMLAAHIDKIVIVREVFYHYEFNNLSLNNSKKFNKAKIKNIVDALKKIVIFLNALDIPNAVYQEVVTARYNTVIKTFFEKCDDSFENIIFFENIISTVKDIIKYPLLQDSWEKIEVLKNVAIARDSVFNGYDAGIPKNIFYVWGVNEPLKDSVKKYIATWKEKLPDYQIIQIDESCDTVFHFKKELESNRWFRTVYDKKMWAYVADYVRIKTLYECGGIYFDTDVEVVKAFDEDMLKNPAFVGIQDSSADGTFDYVEPAILGSQKGNLFLKKILSFYDELIWKEKIYTMPEIFAYFLEGYGIYPFPRKENQQIIRLPDITIYPEEYFIPFRYKTDFSPHCITSKTKTIHWWGGSWVNSSNLNFLKNKHLFSQLRNRINS